MVFVSVESKTAKNTPTKTNKQTIKWLSVCFVIKQGIFPLLGWHIQHDDDYDIYRIKRKVQLAQISHLMLHMHKHSIDNTHLNNFNWAGWQLMREYFPSNSSCSNNIKYITLFQAFYTSVFCILQVIKHWRCIQKAWERG